MGISIIGTGRYLPHRIATNEDFAKMVDTSDEWIISRTGIKTRHIATDELSWQMAEKAGREALDASGISPDEIGLVVASTVTGDYITPSLACLVARSLGIPNAICFDINAACAGFAYVLDVARRYLEDDTCKYALVISAEMMSKIVDYTDRATCVLFGDGSGAAIVKKADTRFYGHFGSDPVGLPHLIARGHWPENPFMEEDLPRTSDGFVETTTTKLYQNGKEVYKFATRVMPTAIKAVCEKASISPADIKLVIPHQANVRIIETAAKALGLTDEQLFVNIEKYGNMSSACIPIALDEAVKSGRINKGELLCLVGFGGGLVYGACLFEF